MQQSVFDHFQQRLESTMALAESCSQHLPEAAQQFAECFLNGGKVLIYGSGHSASLAALAEHYFLFGYNFERPPFPALAMRPDCDAQSAVTLLQQLAQPGDLLLVLADPQQPEQGAELIAQARRAALRSLSLGATGEEHASAGQLALPLAAATEHSTPLVNLQLEALQCLCHLIDQQVFGAD